MPYETSTFQPDAPQSFSRDKKFRVMSPRLSPEVDHAEALRSPNFSESSHRTSNCWTLEQFMDEVIPLDGAAIRVPLTRVIQALAKKATDAYTPFLQATGSRGALGVSRNMDYLSIGIALEQFARKDHIPKANTQDSSFHNQMENVFIACQNQMVNFCRKAIIDVDLDFAVPDMDMEKFAKIWQKTTGYNEFYSKDESEGMPIHRDWKTFIIEPKPGVKVFIVQIGLFNFYYLDEPKDVQNHVAFSLDFYHSPPVYPNSLNQSDARGGSLVAAPERIRRNFYNIDGQIYIMWDREALATVDSVVRYGIGLLDIDLPLEALRQPRLAIEKVARLLRIKTLAPQTCDVGNHLAEKIDTIFSPQHLSYVAPDVWREEIMPNILSSIHLSPFIAAVNLLPNHILDDLSPNIKDRIANHAIDYSLSMGNLWEVFRNITPEQANNLLATLPNHKDWDPTKANGIDLFVESLFKVGILRKEHSFGNDLLDVMRLFSHPDDEDIKLLTLLQNLSSRLRSNNLPMEMVEPDNTREIQSIISIIQKRKPKWVNQSFVDMIYGLVR